MGANIGTGDGKRSVNVELNLVPFIDLMSCLTAFLLVTAVWVNIARMDTRARGQSKAGIEPDTKDPMLSVLVDAEGIWVGEAPGGGIEHITGHDWTALSATLAAHKAGPVFIDRTVLQLAAESTRDKVVPYQDLISAMDIAHQVGFTDVGISDPAGLTTRPTL